MGLSEDTTKTGEIEGILVRRYDIEDELLDEADTFSGARSRFDSSIEGGRVQRVIVHKNQQKIRGQKSCAADETSRSRSRQPRGRNVEGSENKDMEKAHEAAATVARNSSACDAGVTAVTSRIEDKGCHVHLKPRPRSSARLTLGITGAYTPGQFD